MNVKSVSSIMDLQCYDSIHVFTCIRTTNAPKIGSISDFHRLIDYSIRKPFRISTKFVINDLM